MVTDCWCLDADDSTVVGCFYDNSRREELLGLGKKPPPTDEQKQRQGEMLEEDDERPLTLADWYGLSPAVEPFLTVVGELSEYFECRDEYDS